MPENTGKTRYLSIKVVENGKKKFKLKLPVFLISFPLFLIPRSVFFKVTGEEEIDLKGLIRALLREGRGARINVHDKGSQVSIEFR